MSQFYIIFFMGKTLMTPLLSLCLTYVVSMDIMLCHYRYTIMLLLLAPCLVDSHFELGSLSSTTAARWKQRMENALHVVCTNKCCCLQAAILVCLFSVSSEISSFQISLKCCDIIFKLYRQLLTSRNF